MSVQVLPRSVWRGLLAMAASMYEFSVRWEEMVAAGEKESS